LLVLAGCGPSSTKGAAASGAANDAGATGTPGKLKMNGTCPTNSGFPGDDLCLAPPLESEGFQLHYGPSSYDNPDEVAKFTLEPGQETNDCLFVKTPNQADIVYSGTNIQMRTGSHHLIGQTRATPVPDGFSACIQNDQLPMGTLAGAQTPREDRRTDPAAENQGFGRLVPANTQGVLNFHGINTTEANTLREAWLNYYYLPEGQLTAQRGHVDLTGGLGFKITPGTHKTYQYSCSPTVPVRILSLSSHMHAHSLRMTVWKVSGQQKTKVLDSYSWEEPVAVYYDSAHTNAPGDPTNLKTGGDVSGTLTLDPTDTLDWECEINNDGPNTLTFKNEVFTGEMCLLVGSIVPVVNPKTVADFSCFKP
jgi:hypothetical protein